MTCSEYYRTLLTAIPGPAPCGEALDYDPVFIMLQSALQPKLGAEYGNFVEVAEPVNWAEIERECQTLLQKSKDIRLIVVLIRCRLRSTGLAALTEGLEAIYALLQAWPDDLYPQLLDEGEFAPMMRANAMAELEDISGLLNDLRNQSLPRASGLQVTIREFEKAHLLPREEGTLSEASVAALIHDWHLSGHEQLVVLAQAHYFLREICKILRDTLAPEAPDLSTLNGLLALFSRDFSFAVLPAPVSQPEAATLADAEPQADVAGHCAADILPATQGSPDTMTAHTLARREITHRNDALCRLQEVRSWFAMTEPSSPLVLMLKYAEASIGKSFADLVRMYPPEIITMLQQDRE